MGEQRNMKKAEQLSTSPHASNQLINTIFKPLSQLDKTLPTRIIEYILHGDELDVLVDFDKLCQISNNAVKLYELLERPAEFHCSRYNYSSINYGIHWLLKARNNFYKSWTDTYTPEQIVRYARVLATLFDHLHFIKYVSEQIPSWFIYLLYDGLITTLPCYCENKDKIEERENWSMQQLHQLLEIEQAGLGEKLLFAIFDRQNITATRFDFFEYFTRLNGLLSYIQDRIELFKQLPSLGLSLLGQVEQLNYIQRYPELQLQLVDFIVMQVSNTSKQVSQLAKEILLNLPHELVRPQLQHFLTSGSAKQRANAAILLSRIISEPTILQQALANETDKTVIAALESALIRLEIANAVKQQADLVIPRFEPLVDTPLPPSARDVLQQNFDEYLIECKKWMQNELEEKQKNKESSSTEHQNRYIKLKTVTSKSLDNIFEYLNGKIDRSTLFKEINEEIDFEFLFTKNRLLNLPEFSLFHLFRMNELLSSLESNYSFEMLYDKYDIFKNFDLRQIADVMIKLNFHPHVEYEIARLFLNNDFYHNIYENEPYKLWAFFAENDFLIDQALGFAPLQIALFSYYNIDKICAIKILQLFPTIPAKYVAYLIELALGERKPARYAAQNVLKRIPEIYNQVKKVSKIEQSRLINFQKCY